MTQKLTINLTDDELREIFALFSSPTDYERQQAYDETNAHFYEREDLSREYTLTQERREFAEDAWRAVMFFLHRRDFRLTKNGEEYDPAASSGYSAEAGGGALEH
jgi:hypothetical protein